MKQPAPGAEPLSIGALVAPAAVAALLPLVVHAAIWLSSRQPERLFEGPVLMLFAAAWAALPFLAWALVCSRSNSRAKHFRRVCGLGLLGALVIWGWIFWAGYQQQAGTAMADSTVNVGLVMLAMPLVMFALLFGIDAISRSGTRVPH